MLICWSYQLISNNSLKIAGWSICGVCPASDIYCIPSLKTLENGRLSRESFFTKGSFFPSKIAFGTVDLLRTVDLLKISNSIDIIPFECDIAKMDLNTGIGLAYYFYNIPDMFFGNRIFCKSIGFLL